MICTYKEFTKPIIVGKVMPLWEVPPGLWFTYTEKGWSMKGGRWGRKNRYSSDSIDEFFAGAIRPNDWELSVYLQYRNMLVKVVGTELPPEAHK